MTLHWHKYAVILYEKIMESPECGSAVAAAWAYRYAIAAYGLGASGAIKERGKKQAND